ncbi:hypothetical protein CFB03_10815 [Salmonella enterica subsp. enterica serovar Typhimurium]|nr:hypothetical protein CFB03_10815 [Salmonella enterica subsp. enterica serovar Typhimurium]
MIIHLVYDCVFAIVMVILLAYIMNRNGVTQDTLRLRWHSICLCQRLYVFRILTLSLFLILYAW